MADGDQLIPGTVYERLRLKDAVMVACALTVDPDQVLRYNMELASGSHLTRPLLGLLVRRGLCEKKALGYNLPEDQALRLVRVVERYDPAARIIIALAERAKVLSRPPTSLSLEEAVLQVGLATSL